MRTLLLTGASAGIARRIDAGASRRHLRTRARIRRGVAGCGLPPRLCPALPKPRRPRYAPLPIRPYAYPPPPRYRYGPPGYGPQPG